MSDSAPHIPPQQQQASILGTIGLVAGSLPAPFLALLLVNVVFLAVVVWFLRDVQAQRVELLTRVLESCMQIETGKFKP